MRLSAIGVDLEFSFVTGVCTEPEVKYVVSLFLDAFARLIG
jgi:hypothetical protein